MYDDTIQKDGTAKKGNSAGRHEQGLLLVGHGTRDQRGIDEFFATAVLIAERLPNVAVEPCFLELAEPTIPEAVERLAAGGVEQMVVSPSLLFAAGHVKHDIPDAVHAALRRYDHIQISYQDHLGLHPKILRASADRFLDAVNQSPSVLPQDCTLLMVGRGSLDDSATAEMLAFAEERARLIPVRQVATCFVAMAQPTFNEAVTLLMESRPPVVIVQPHLLFHGELLSTVQRFVDEAIRRYSKSTTAETQWRIAKHLGVDPLVADALMDLYARK